MHDGQCDVSILIAHLYQRKVMRMKEKLCYTICFLYFSISSYSASPVYPAQIAGRNLNTPGLGMLGHVAVTTAPFINQIAYQVLEVLNESPVIQLNTLSYFKKQSPYWGSRYGISDRDTHALQLLREGNAQRCLGAEYTTTSISWAAIGDIHNYPNCKTVRIGRFRCDTYIDYIFGVAGYNVTPNGKTAPSIVFYAFPYGNGDGPYALPSKNSVKPTASRYLVSITTSIDLVAVEELEEMSPDEFMGLLDISRNNITDKIIEKIWEHSLNPMLSIEKRLILLDYLGGVAKINMIPNFIVQYPKFNDLRLKSMLLRDIQDVYQKYLSSNTIISIKESLKKFYTQQLDIDLSAQDSERVARGFITFHSNRVVLANIDKINVLFNKVNPYTRIGLKTNLTFRLKKLEPIVISDIIDLLEMQNDPQLDERFFLYVVDTLSAGIDRLSPELKSKIGIYIDSVQYKFNYNKVYLSKKASILSCGAWLEASALVNSATLEEAGRYIANFLKNLKTINEQESYIIGLSSSFYMKKAFNTEEVLIKFKKQRKEVYLNTVGEGAPA